MLGGYRPVGRNQKNKSFLFFVCLHIRFLGDITSMPLLFVRHWRSHGIEVFLFILIVKFLFEIYTSLVLIHFFIWPEKQMIHVYAVHNTRMQHRRQNIVTTRQAFSFSNRLRAHENYNFDPLIYLCLERNVSRPLFIYV